MRLRIEDWHVDSDKLGDTWLFHTDFDMNTDGGTISYPEVVRSKGLTDETKRFFDWLKMLPQISSFTLDCHSLKVKKTGGYSWTGVVSLIRSGFKVEFERIVEFHYK